MSSDTEEEQIPTPDEVFQYYYNMWKALDFAFKPILDEGLKFIFKRFSLLKPTKKCTTL